MTETIRLFGTYFTTHELYIMFALVWLYGMAGGILIFGTIMWKRGAL